MSSERRRVAIVGMGAVTPAGVTAAETIEGVGAGRSFVRRLGWDVAGCGTDIGATPAAFDPTQTMDRGEVRRTDRATQFAIAAATEAVEAAGGLHAHPPHRRGAVVGTGSAGLGTWADSYAEWTRRGARGLSPFIVPMIMPNSSAAHLSMRFDLRGPSLTVGGACAAGSQAIHDAVNLVRSGTLDVVIAGGTEALLVPIILAAFARTGALSRRNDAPDEASRPFDRDRDGFVLGEGAGMLVLEEMSSATARGARILGEVAGVASSSDAFHIAAPRPDGSAIVAAMTAAIADAGVSRRALGHVHAHGTGTVPNDLIEATALERVFDGDVPPVTSAKGSVGHLIGAAGPVELITSVAAMDRSVVFPVANHSCPGEGINVGVATRCDDVAAGGFLKNSFAFGGQNVSLVVMPAEARE